MSPTSAVERLYPFSRMMKGERDQPVTLGKPDALQGSSVQGRSIDDNHLGDLLVFRSQGVVLVQRGFLISERVKRPIRPGFNSFSRLRRVLDHQVVARLKNRIRQWKNERAGPALDA
ncbi:MAG: hypothetical protein MZV70_12290 [Desulfobacterales bacterium]|nr:hypothetical protein [Desulfobacterales bacterium]